MRVPSKEAIRTPHPHAGLPNGDDFYSRLLRGVTDFRIGMRAFTDKREPQWTRKLMVAPQPAGLKCAPKMGSLEHNRMLRREQATRIAAIAAADH